MLAQTEQAIGLSWTWSELVTALRACQDSDTTSLIIARTVMDRLVEKLVSPRNNHYYSPTTTTSSTWWFEDLVFLDNDYLETLTKTMVSNGLSHNLVSKFLFYYYRHRNHCAEAVIALLSLLDGRSVSFKGLFEIYYRARARARAMAMKVRKKHRRALESLIGSQLDRATLDYLIVKSPRGSDHVYDLDMVLGLVKSFLSNIADHRRRDRLSKVGRLMDLYLSEVAPDPKTKHSKFLELVTALPDRARESHDGLYRAVDVYLEVHHGELCEGEKASLCHALDHGKLSVEALKHLARNSKFPWRVSVEGFVWRGSKLRSLMVKRLGEDWNYQVQLKEPMLCYYGGTTSGRFLPRLCGC